MAQNEHEPQQTSPEITVEPQVEEEEEEEEATWNRPRDLPADLPRSLDDRRQNPTYEYGGETEFYDGWQGQSQFLAPTLGRSNNFNLSLNEPDEDARTSQELAENDARLAQMLAVQARMNDEDDNAESAEDGVLTDEDLSETERKQMLQDFLFMAASNGDDARVSRLVTGKAAKYIKVNAVDAEGTPPLVYASCFGHRDVVQALLDAGATVDQQDKNQWTALMWAMTNRHKDIAKILLDHGASTEITSSTGRTALDFVPPDSEMLEYLHDAGYRIGSAGVAGDDFYSAGLSQDRFEEELAENEMKRRMMMESARNLEVDLGNLGIDEQPESPDDIAEAPEFVWDRCLHDQMFVFQENDINRILNIIITDMTPQRSPSQKPIPANIIFLGARYAHYHANKELLSSWLVAAQEKIYAVVDRHQWDMTMLAFWMSNTTLLLYYLKKDTGLTQVTPQFHAQMAEQIHEIYILILRDAERRMDKVLDGAILEHETIPGFEDIHFQNEWSFLRKKAKVEVPEPLEKRIRAPSPRRRAQISPRNITSLLSSTLFVLDLYDVHSVITAQALSQLLYWLAAEIFNRIMANKRFLARTKAMQIRMNISTLEDWARNNNRNPEHYEGGSMTASGENTVDAARRHMAPVVQLLQWLQCFSSLGTDHEAIDITLQQLPTLTSKQLLHAVRHYRAEVGEKTLPKQTLRYVGDKKKDLNTQRKREELERQSLPPTPTTPAKPNGASNGAPAAPIQSSPSIGTEKLEDESPEILLNAGSLLPFHLPTSTDMLVTYGAGFGGVNKERARRYIPTIPPDFFQKLDPGAGRKGSKAGLYEGAGIEEDEAGAQEDGKV
ncbi:hypothetical protein KVT40_008825 [Elsinoe batatas]|uniref:Dilute domain-containing protein n=1 Tax=Elsinoe batatas TaxID=2601811 RepID=A0A8K0PFS4_9PEZI|nr:hypothetical protein KVT40_008825 [Elsinoe batatas]